MVAAHRADEVRARDGRNLRCSTTSTGQRRSMRCRRPISSDQRRGHWRKSSSKPCQLKWALITGFLSRAEWHGRGPASVIFGFSLLFVVRFLAHFTKAGHYLSAVLPEHAGPRYRAFECCGCAGQVLSVLYPAYHLQIENDVYSQIGLVMLICLAARTRSYREFAKEEDENGDPWWMLGGSRRSKTSSASHSDDVLWRSFLASCRSGQRRRGIVARQIMVTPVIGAC